jgi:hypothetical protein
MERLTENTRRLIVTVDNATADVWRAIHSLSDSDLLRPKALAGLWSRGLPGAMGWSDVLHEAIVRALSGARRWPAGVPILAFLSGIMRSICEDQWRRDKLELDIFASDRHLGSEDDIEATCDPEQALNAAQALAAINKLFAADTASRMACRHPKSASTTACRNVEYDAARKRMRRALLRHGIEWSAS